MKLILKYIGFTIVGAVVLITIPIWIVPALCIHIGKSLHEEGFSWD